MCAVGSSKVVEALPFVEFSLQINVAFVAEKMIEYPLIGPVRSFDFTMVSPQVLSLPLVRIVIPEPDLTDSL